jgi:archaellum biogenesis ATPase FlaH
MQNLLSSQSNKSIFIIKSGNDWLDEAKSLPIPRSLFMESWFEGELCILFADSNVGKSILAVQIGATIAKTQPVIYFDFELSAKQFEGRYSNEYTDHFEFPENFKRAELNTDHVDYQKAGFKNIEEFIYDSIRQGIIDHNAKIVIIDNLTYLRTETEKSKEALPLMKYLKELKREFGLSILALAHTPKRNMTLPISQNDLGGSKMLMNFCDSSFSIGFSSKAKDLRYLKQIKIRAAAIKYDTNNVAVFRLCKPNNYLMFKRERDEHSENMNSEQEHLKITPQRENKKDIYSKINEFRNKGMTVRQIADFLSVSSGFVSNTINSQEYISFVHDSRNSQNSRVHENSKNLSLDFSHTKPNFIQTSNQQPESQRFDFAHVESATIEDMPINWPNE